MGSLCAVGTEPISDPDRRLVLEDGVFCTILGFQHPLCRLIDRVWYVTAQVFDLANPSDAPIEASKFWWSWARRFAYQTMEDAATIGLRVGDLCAYEPAITSDPVSYWDLVNFLTGQDDAILVKVFEIWKFRVWFEYCRCKTNRVSFPPTVSPPTPIVPGVPYCGGIVSGPSPAAIAQCLAPLLKRIQELANQYAAAGAAFWDIANQLLQDEPYQVTPNGSYPIGDVLFTGPLGQGWILFQSDIACDGDFPERMPIFPFGLRVTCEDAAGKVELAIRETGILYEVRYLVRSEGIMTPSDPDQPSIGPGWTFFVGDYRVGYFEMVPCFYSRITPYLPPCPPTGGRYGPWNSPGPNDPISDDQAICLDVPALCAYRLPDCCGGYEVLLEPRDQIALAEALGFEISQGASE